MGEDGQHRRWVVMGVPAAGLRVPRWWTGPTGDRRIRAGGYLDVARWRCVVVAAAPGSRSASVDRPRPVGPTWRGRSGGLRTRPRSHGPGEWHRALHGHDSWNGERSRPHDLPGRILGVDGGLGTNGAGLCEEAVERRRSLGWSAPPAGAPSRSPAPGRGWGVVARH